MAKIVLEKQVCPPKITSIGAYALFKKRFKVALGCMAIRTQTKLIIRRVQFIRKTKEAATQTACAGNTRGYHSEYWNSWFNTG